MALVWSCDAESFTANTSQYQTSPLDVTKSLSNIQYKNNGSIGDQYNVKTAPYGGNRLELKVRPGDFTNGTRGRCEWMVFGPGTPTYGGIPNLDGTTFPRLKLAGDELYFSLRTNPTFTSEPGDSNLTQFKPTGCHNQYVVPFFGFKYAGGMTQLRVYANGGTVPTDCSGAAVSGTRTWNNYYGASGTVQPNMLNDYVWRLLFDPNGTGGFTVWARFLDPTSPDESTAYTKILEQTNIRIGWKESDGSALPPAYWRGGLYCVLSSTTTYTTYQDNMKVGQSFDDVTTASAPPAGGGGSLPSLGLGRRRIGVTSIGGSRGGGSADLKRVTKVATGLGASEEGDIEKIYAYLEGVSTTGNQAYKAIVYSDSGSGGAPGARLGYSAEVIVGATDTGAWKTFTFSPSVHFTGQNIWIGIISGATGSKTKYAYAAVTSALRFNSDTYSDGPSDPFGTTSTSDVLISACADYNPVAGTSGGGTDTTAPSFVSASVIEDILSIVFNEPLNTNTPATSAFTVIVDGTTLAVSSVAAPVGDTLTLTMASPIKQPQSATVAYTQPGSNKISDLAGNAAASFTAQSVENLTSIGPIRFPGTGHNIGGRIVGGTRIPGGGGGG